MKQLFEQHTEFTRATFPEATAESSIEKLRGEFEELWHNILHTAELEDCAEEYVDCVMCLFDSARRLGITGEMFESAFRAKLAKNKSRTWVKNPDNTYSHVKQ